MITKQMNTTNNSGAKAHNVKLCGGGTQDA